MGDGGGNGMGSGDLGGWRRGGVEVGWVGGGGGALAQQRAALRILPGSLEESYITHL